MSRILIIDDEKQIRGLLGALLRAEGREIREARGGVTRSVSGVRWRSIVVLMARPHR